MGSGGSDENPEPTIQQRIRAFPVLGIRDVFAGDSVADLSWMRWRWAAGASMQGDILVVKHKIVSKAEGRMVALDTVKPSAAAKKFAAE